MAGLAFPLAAVIVGVLRNKSLASVFAPGRMTPGLFAWTIVGSAGMIALMLGLIETLLEFMPWNYKPELDELAKFIMDLPPGVAFLVTIVMAPLCEEVFFRGAVLRGIRSSWGTAAGVLLSSALFAAWHVLPPRMIVTFILGLWFGGLAIASGGLAAPILAHAINNTVVLVLLVAGVDRIPPGVAVPGGLVLLLAAWRIFATARSVQGSGPPRAS
jgi:membrane protease YdiL (CAAX protease family)